MRNRSSRSGGRSRSRRRLWAFRVIAMLLPLCLLVVVEFALRWFGYGHDTRLFIRYPDDPRYYVMNKYAAERYFTDTVNETKGSIEPFLVDKPAGTFRIFVLGESTTAGYPYFHNGSFHRWLEFRLMHEYPGLHFEIINVSLTAVNSYTVLDFGRQVLAYQPDALLVYTGHNEYYGALGVGSTSHIANSRWLVWTIVNLRRLRLVQWFGRLWSGLRSLVRGSPATPDQRENLMQRMAADQRIALGSPAYAAGIVQYRENMDELCRITRARGVPVFLSTVVSNEKDQRPFIGAGGSAFAAGRADASFAAGGADAAFAAGDSAWRVGDYAAAKRDYVAARDADLLRFRAPSAIDSVIRVLAGEYSNVHLVDALARFETASPHGVVGHETLLEHVHPNLYGYALLSDAFHRSMMAAHLFPSPPADTLGFDSLLVKMPVTAVDSLNGVYTILMLKSRWPFDEPIPVGFKRGSSIAEQLAGGLAVGRIDWSQALNELYTLSMRVGDKRTAVKAVEALSLDRPLYTRYALYAGRLNFELGDTGEAVFYFKQACAIDPSPINIQSLNMLYKKMNH